MIWKILGSTGHGHTTETRGQTLRCVVGSTIPCMTYWRLLYSAAGVHMGRCHAQCACSSLIFIWLKKGDKYSAFDQHRQFLPEGHPFRHDKKNFRKGIAVHDKVDVPVFNGEAVL